jgi:hypothetical protein
MTFHQMKQISSFWRFTMVMFCMVKWHLVGEMPQFGVHILQLDLKVAGVSHAASHEI